MSDSEFAERPAKGWTTDTLGAICRSGGGSIQTGPFGSQLHAEDYKEDGTPIITVEHLKEGKIAHENLPLVGKDDCRRLQRYKLSTGDLVFSRVGAIDRCAYVSDAENGWLFSGRCLRVRSGKGEADSRFLSYLLNSFDQRQWILNHSVGSTMACLNTAILSGVPISHPPLPPQRKIARILTTVDNLIEKTEALIAKYQAIKQGMMHDLFTRGVDEHGHLRPPYEEAPELYKQSELGWIPKEWDSGTLGSVCHWMSGATPSKSNAAFWSGSVPWFSPKDMKSFELIDSEDHISDEASHCGTRLIDPGTVLIVIRGMILAHSFPVGITTRTATFNQDIKALTCDGPVFGRFLAYWLTAHAQEMVNLATESTHGTKRFDMDDLYSVSLGVPNKEEQSRTVRLLDTLGNNLKAEQARLRNLLQIKTGLMQDLLTGKVGVKVDNAEEVASAHA